MRVRLLDPDAERRFTAYSKFVKQFNVAANASTPSGVGDHPSLVAETRSRPATARICRRRLEDTEMREVSRALRLSWVMEAQLVLRESHDVGLLPDLLQGAAGEAYYAVYHALRAFLLASRDDVGTDHAAILRSWSNEMRQRDLVPTLWRTQSVGRPGTPTFQVRELPAGVTPTPHSVLAAPRIEEAWDDVATALKTTRERQLVSMRSEWLKAKHAKRMPAAEAQAQATRLPPTTVVDFFWRLRTGSHYKGAEMFLDGVGSPGQALGYHQDLRRLTSATITVLNTLTQAYLGPDAMGEGARPFIARGNVETYKEFRARWSALGF